MNFKEPLPATPNIENSQKNPSTPSSELNAQHLKESLRIQDRNFKDAVRVIDLMTEARRYSGVVRGEKKSVPPEAIKDLAEELEKTVYYAGKTQAIMEARVRTMFNDNTFDDEIEEFIHYRDEATKFIEKINRDLEELDRRHSVVNQKPTMNRQETEQVEALIKKIQSGSGENNHHGNKPEQVQPSAPTQATQEQTVPQYQAQEPKGVSVRERFSAFVSQFRSKKPEQVQPSAPTQATQEQTVPQYQAQEPKGVSVRERFSAFVSRFKPKPVEQKETPTQEKPKSQNTSEIFAVIDKKIAEEKAQLIPEARRHKTKEELFDWMYKREQLGSVAISLSEASQHLFEADPENAFMIESIEASRKDVDGYAKKVRETKKYEDFRDNTTYSKEPRKQELGLLAKNVRNVYGNQNYDFSNTLRDTGRNQERQERLEYNIRQAEEALRKKRASFNYRTEQEYKAYKRRRSALSP